jgi:trigger factor
MQTDIKEIGPCKLQIKIEIPAETIKEKLNEKYKDFTASAIVPGFRKGLAPKDLIERKFGKDIRDEFKTDMIQTTLLDVVKEKKLQPIGDPQIDYEKIKLEESQPLAFEVVMEVEPTVTLTDYTGIKATKPAIDVTEKEIDESLEHVRKNRGEWHVAEKKAAQKDDMVIFNQETWVDNKRIHQAENSNYIVGQELKFLGKAANALSDAMVGVKTGDAKEVTLKVPDNAEKAEYRGKDAQLKITIKEVKELKFPELNDEWIKSIGFDSMKRMREEVKKQLLKHKEEEVNLKVEDQILEDLLKRANFPLPETLVNENVNNILRRWMTNMLVQKKPEKEIMAEVENLKPKAKELSEKELRVEFICDFITKKEKIFVTEDDMNQRINELAGRYQQLPNEVKKYYEDNNLTGQLRSEIREEKVRKFLREKAVITEEKAGAVEATEPAKPKEKAEAAEHAKHKEKTDPSETADPAKPKHHKPEKKG